MAIKKVNEILGKLISNRDVSSVLTEIKPVSASTKATYKIAEDAKLGITPNITVAQSILQKTGIKNNIKNYSDSLNSLLTNYLANNLSIPSTKSGKLENALEVSVEEMSYGTTVYIKNDGKETSIYVSENGSLIEVIQNISNERYGQYVLSSTSKEQPIEENLLVELHDDGNMNVLNQQTTIQKTESLKNPDGTPTGEHICSVKSNATAYIQRATGEKLFIPSPEVASCEINYKENATVESIASRFDTVNNVIDTHKGIASNSFENIERIYYLQEYKGSLPVKNNDYVSFIQNEILTNRSVENSRYDCPYPKEFPTITDSSTKEEMDAKANSLNQRAKQLYRKYASDPKEVLTHKQDKPSHYTLKPEAIEELKNGVHSDEVMRALISNPTKQVLDKSKEFFSTLAKGYEGTDPNVVVTLFDGRYSSFIATITAEGKDSTVLNVGPKEYSYTIERYKDEYGKDKLKLGNLYNTQKIEITNLNINKENSFGTVCNPAVNTICCNYTVTNVTKIPAGSIKSLQVGLPAYVEHTGYNKVGKYKDLSYYKQFPNAPYSCFTNTEETVFDSGTGEVSFIKTEEYTDEDGQSFAGKPTTTKIEGVEIKPTIPGKFVVSKTQIEENDINQ